MIDPAEVLGKWDQLTPNVSRLVDLFVSAEGIGRRYLLGRNEHSQALAKAINVDGFVDDFAPVGAVWNDKPVLRGEDLPIGAIVVNCSMSIRPLSAHKRIENLGLDGPLTYSDLCKTFPDRFVLPDFVLETREDIRVNQARWEAMSERFADATSRQILDDLLRYRLTADYRIMTPYKVRFEDQYFEDFLGLGSNEVFVDAGGFDGDTTQLFCERNPTYRQVFFFEPSSINLEKAKARLHRFRDIEFFPTGVSDAVGSLWFNADRGSSSSISNLGSTRIDVTTIDEQINSKVTFIKMDLEGWELKALTGSTRHILEDHPKLAIAVYHHSSDFWRIFEFVTGLRNDYNVFLRHYTEGWSETVMFFVPS